MEVGSVSIQLDLERAGFDRDISSVERTAIDPIKAPLKLEKGEFDRQVKGIGDLIKPIVAPLDADTKGLQRQLSGLKLDAMPVQLTPDLQAFNRQIQSYKAPEVTVKLKTDASEINKISDQITTEVKTKVEAKISVDGGTSGGFSPASMEGAIAKGMQGAMESQGRSSKADSMGQQFTDFMLSPLNAAYKGLKTVVSGALENVGKSFSDSFGKSLAQGLDKDFGSVLQKAGAKVGESFGFLGKEITSKTKYKDSLNNDTKGSFTELQQDLKPIVTDINQVASAFKKVGLDIGGFASHIQNASNSALSLISAFTKLETIVSKSSLQQTKSSATTATQGFLTGDIKNLTTIQARGQVDGARKQLESQLNELKSLPQTSETRGKVAELINQISELEQKIANDIKNSAIPESVRRSLGKLKGAGGKLSELKTEAEKMRLSMGSPTAQRDESQVKARPSTQNLSLYRAQSLPQGGLPVASFASGNSGNRDSLMGIEQEAKLAQANFKRIFKQVAKLSGMPSEQSKNANLGLEFKDLGEGVKGAYNARNNSVSLANGLQSKLAQGILSKDELNTLIHEIRHALQIDFGNTRVTGIATGNQRAGVKLQAKAPDSVKKDVDASVEEYRQAFKQEFGKEPPQKLLDTIRKLETDAYAFAEKAIFQISQNLAKTLKLNPDKPAQAVRPSRLPTPPPPPPELAINRRPRASTLPTPPPPPDFKLPFESSSNPARREPEELKKTLRSNLLRMNAIAERIQQEQQEEFGQSYGIKTIKGLLNNGQIPDAEYKALKRSQAQAAQEYKGAIQGGYKPFVRSTAIPIPPPPPAIPPRARESIRPELEIQNLQNTTNQATKAWWNGTTNQLRQIGKDINQSFNPKVSASSIKLDNIKAEIEKNQQYMAKAISDLQQKLIAEGMNVTRANVAKMLRSGQYYDPQFNTAQARTKELQFTRADIQKGNQPSIVDGSTGQKRLVAANDPIFKKLADTQRKLDDSARKAQAEILKETGQQYKLTTVKNFLRQGKFEGTSAGNEYSNLQRQKQQQIEELNRRRTAAVAPPSPRPANDAQRFENMFRRLEVMLYRSPMLRGVPASSRRSLVSEATGFVFSGAAMINPLATFGALLAPLTPAIAPLITTFGLLGNALKPLIDVVTETIKKLEPATKRLEFVSGSKEAAQKDIKFVTDTSDKLDTPQLASIEGFSKLSAAAKGTSLEGGGVKELFEGISTASKALQLSQEDLNLVMFGFSQSLSKQRLTAEEVRLQIGERLPGAISVFAKSLNMTVPEFNEALESGKLGIESLAKLGKGFQQYFQQGAEAASGGLLAALTRVDNAVLKLQKGLADAFGPALAMFNNGFASLINFISSNLENIIKVFNVAVIGIAAQFLVGMTVILQGSGIPQKIAAFLTPLVARAASTMTPFVLGIAADLLDDVFGAKASVMDNMMKGFYNMVLTVILAVDGAIKKVRELFNVADSGIKSLPKIPTQGEKPEGNRMLDTLGTTVVAGISGGLMGGAKGGAVGAVAGAIFGIVGGMDALRKIMPSVFVEFASLMLILMQSVVLLKMSLGVQIAAFVGNLKAMASAFLINAKNGGVFRSGLNTLSAGFDKAQLKMAAFSAAFILFFAKANFSNELGSSFDKLGDQMASAMQKAALSTQKVVDKQKELKSKTELKSQGFDLTFGLGESFGMENGFRTDDMIKRFRQSTLDDIDESESRGQISKERASQLRQEVKDSYRTFADNNFDSNLLKIDERKQELAAITDGSGLFSGQFKSTKAGESFERVKQIDSEIKNLQNQRLDLVEKPGATKDPAISKQVQELEKQIKDKEKERGEAVKPVQQLRDSILSSEKVFQDALAKINEDPNLPEASKQQMRDRLQPAIAEVDKLKEKLKELGLIDLSPLGKQFSEVQSAIEKSNIELENDKMLRQVELAKNQQVDYEDYAAGKITKEELDVNLKTSERKSLQKDADILRATLDTRKTQVRDLLAVPNPSKDQKEVIEKTQKEIRDKELELAKTRIQIAQNVADAKRQSEEEALRAFQEANAKVASTIQRQQTEQVTGIKSRLMRGQITQEEADKQLAGNSSNSALQDIEEAKRQLANFEAKRSTFNSKEAIKQESELQRNLAEANLKYIESELSRIDLRKKQIIDDLERANRKAEATINLSQTNRTTAIKSQLLDGDISPEQAARLQNKIDQDATDESIANIKRRIEENKRLRKEGTRDAKTADDIEIQLNQDLAKANQQAIDQQIQAQEQLRDAIDKTLQRRKAQLDLEKLGADIDFESTILGQARTKTNRLSSNSPRDIRATELSDRALELNNKGAALSSERTSIEKQAALIDEQIAGLDKLNLSTEQYNDRRTALENEYGQLALRYLKNQQEQEQTKQEKILNNKEVEINAIERAKAAEQNRHQLLVSQLDEQKSKLDLINQSLELTGKLNESRLNLSKALSDAAVAPLETRKSNADRALELSKRLDDKDLDPRVSREIKNQLGSLGFGTKEIDILNQRAQIEDEIAAKKLEALKTEQAFQRKSLELDLQRQAIAAQMAIYDAEGAQLAAEKSRIEAESALRIAQAKGDDLGIKSAEIGIQLAEKEASIAERKLEAAQSSANAQGELARNAVLAQEVTQRTAIDQQLAADGARKQANALEKVETIAKNSASKNSPGASSGGGADNWENPYIQKKGEGIFDYNLRLNKMRTFGQLVETNNRTSVVEDNILASPNPRTLPPIDRTAQVANDARIQPLESPLTQAINALEYTFSAKIDNLSAAIMQVVNMPRNLTVQTAQPVDDAASIWNDLANQKVGASNL
ncbi:MAG: tape measure protein [Calothrix sp. FI2-JRJ7]|jgi:tape measure domain-containing protein|nr:tape measure protein [Calothrix sp. FI2-JRJ7]